MMAQGVVALLKRKFSPHFPKVLLASIPRQLAGPRQGETYLGLVT